MSNINNVSGTSGGLSVNAKRWIYICISLIVLVFIKNVSFPASIATIKDATLTPDYPLGIINEFTAPEAELCCQSGHGLVILTRADG